LLGFEEDGAVLIYGAAISESVSISGGDDAYDNGDEHRDFTMLGWGFLTWINLRRDCMALVMVFLLLWVCTEIHVVHDNIS